MTLLEESARVARRSILREIYAHTIEAIRVRDVFSAAVRCEAGWLCVADLKYELAMFRRVLLIAVGKAAVPAAETVIERISECVKGRIALEAIVIGPGEMRALPCAVERWQGSHPVPDASARNAAQRVVEALGQTGAEDLVLFLISGGASAMMELPLDEGVTVEETVAFYRALVHSGLNIAEMNTLRKHLSAVKGGRLAEMAPGAAKCTLLVSDVRKGMADVIGSGPTLADASTREECWELMRRPELANGVPERIRALLESRELPETPKEGAACFRRSEHRTVLSTETMLAAAEESCRRRGFHVVVDNTCDEWEYRETAEYLLRRLRALSEEFERVCLLSGGEVLVKVGSDAGVGGRNQQFALYCATKLSAMPVESAVLSAGTDGIDGNSAATGAIADAGTLDRCAERGLDVEGALAAFDAGSIFAELGDAIVTGPTGNNVRDLRVLMAVGSHSSR